MSTMVREINSYRPYVAKTTVAIHGVYFEGEGVRGIQVVIGTEWDDGDHTREVYDEFPGINKSDDFGGLHPDRAVYQNAMARAAEYITRPDDAP